MVREDEKVWEGFCGNGGEPAEWPCYGVMGMAEVFSNVLAGEGGAEPAGLGVSKN